MLEKVILFTSGVLQFTFCFCFAINCFQMKYFLA